MKRISQRKPSQMTQEEARDWLVVNDPEGADFWKCQPHSTDFREAVQDNLRDFGDFEDGKFRYTADATA